MKLTTQQKILLLIPFIVAALFVPLIIMIPLIVAVFLIEYALDIKQKKQKGKVKEMSNRDFTIMFVIFCVVIALLILLVGGGILSLGISVTTMPPNVQEFFVYYESMRISTLELEELFTELNTESAKRVKIATEPESGVELQYTTEELDAVEDYMGKEDVIIGKMLEESDKIDGLITNMESLVPTFTTETQNPVSSLVDSIRNYNSYMINFANYYRDSLSAMGTNVKALRANAPESMVDIATPMAEADRYAQLAVEEATQIDTKANDLCELIEGCKITWYS